MKYVTIVKNVRGFNECFQTVSFDTKDEAVQKVNRESGVFELYKFSTKTSSTFSRLIKWLEENSFDFRVVR